MARLNLAAMQGTEARDARAPAPENANSEPLPAVSIDWSKYDLSMATDGANDAHETQETEQPEPSARSELVQSAQTTMLQAMRESSDEEDDELSTVSDMRENRFLGSPKQWRFHTRLVRKIWEGIETERSRDLSAHLYNAFALKRRAGRTAAQQALGGKDTTPEEGEEVGNEAPFAPRGRWTAWPMPALIVSREGEELHRDADDMYTVSGRPDLRPSADLEECLMARMLREAKERWNAREWGYERVRRPARNGDAAAADAEGSQTEASPPPEAAKEYETDTDFYTDQEGAENMSDDSQSRRSRKIRAGDPVKLRPAIQTDDEKSYKILRPSARHILSRLDDLLLALHKARAAYMNYDEDGSSRRQRPESKSRKRKHGKGGTSKADERNGAGEPESASNEDGNRKQGRRGTEENTKDPEHRPRKRHARSRSAQQKSMSLHDEEFKPASDSEDENFTPTSSSSPSQSESEPKDPALEKSAQKINKKGKDRRKPHNDGNGDEDSDSNGDPTPHDHPKIPPLQRRNERLGLRDWSDIMGLATLSGGFPADAVQRAASRCTQLFGEDMAFRTFEVGRVVDKSKVRKGRGGEGDVVEPAFEYTDGKPTVEELGRWHWRFRKQQTGRKKRGAVGGERDGGDDGVWQTEVRNPESSSFLRHSESFTKEISGYNTLCPVEGCQRSLPGHGFSRTWNLNQHLRRQHPTVSRGRSGTAELEGQDGEPTLRRSLRERPAAQDVKMEALSFDDFDEGPSIVKQEDSS